MIVLQEARTKDDDWTGKGDPAERRRRQNRLHQRAWRRRRALHLTSAAQSPSNLVCQEDVSTLPVLPLADEAMTIQRLVQDHVSGRQRMPISFDLPQSRFAFWDALETLGEPQSLFAYWAELRAQRKREIVSILLQQDLSLAPHVRTFPGQDPRNINVNDITSINALSPYPTGNMARGQCAPAFNFPLSVDHQLFVLIQHNALRGSLTNMAILLNANGISLKGWADFYTEDLPPIPVNAPASLHQTHLQKTIPHEAWIDIIPSATMRDNILRHQDSIDADALCDDFLGGMEDGLSEVQSRGMILWGTPWTEDGWELSEGFARKWSFLLKGCDGFIRSTNRWRESRGEERLIVEV